MILTIMIIVFSAQSFFNYILLGIIFCVWLSVKQGPSNVLVVIRQRGLVYFLFAFIEVEATYLMVKAYQYTTMTSVQVVKYQKLG